jgi:hypothetical protein
LVLHDRESSVSNLFDFQYFGIDALNDFLLIGNKTEMLDRSSNPTWILDFKQLGIDALNRPYNKGTHAFLTFVTLINYIF